MNATLDVVALRSLTAIADCGGFRRAAEGLHLSQSAVSQHVRRLEAVCGRPLVRRDGRGTRFTTEGQLLVGEARTILAAHDDALARVHGLAERPDGAADLVIGSTEHAADALLPAVTRHLAAAFPDRAVRFRIDRGGRLRERLDEGAVDAALLIGTVPGRRVRPAGELPLRWFAAPGVDPLRDAVDALPLVVLDGPCTIRRRALESLTEHRIVARVVCEAGHLAGLLSAVRAGVGVALVADTGAVPEGLERRDGYPAVGPEPLHVEVRNRAPGGLADAVAAAALDVLAVATG